MPRPHAQHRPRRRSRAIGVWLSALGLVAGCGTPDPPQPVSAPELRPELLGAEDALGRSARDDFWTATLGEMMVSSELEAYWATPAEARFSRYGVLLLEARLKADLLERNRSRMSPEQVDTYCAQPSYDACLSYVEEVTGS